MGQNQDFNQQLNWSVDTTGSRKTSLLEDEREPHELMLDSDVTQQSMDSLDGFNSEAELIKLERCRTMPVAALYDAMRQVEECQKRKFASGRSLSMSSLGSLWDQDYSRRATNYTRELEDRENDEFDHTPEEDEDNVDEEVTEEERGAVSQALRSEQSSSGPLQHSFRLHTPIPEEDCCSSGSNESITYVFMNPQPSPVGVQDGSNGSFSMVPPASSTFSNSLSSNGIPPTNPSSILHYRPTHHQPQSNTHRLFSESSTDPDDGSEKNYPNVLRTSSRAPPQHALQQQPRTLSMDSIDMEQCMNFINRSEPSASSSHSRQRQTQRHDESKTARAAYNGTAYSVDTPHTTLERAQAGRRLRRDNSAVHIESTDQEYPGMEQTPYQVESAATDPETTGPEQSPRLWSLLRHYPRRQSHQKRHSHDSGSDHDGNDLLGHRVPTLQRPPSQGARRSATKVRRKPSRTRAIETQTDDEVTGYSSQPSSPGVTRKTFPNEGYALMRSITSGGAFNEAAKQLQTRGDVEPTVHLLTEVVSLMKMMMTNLPQARCRTCTHCQCNPSDCQTLKRDELKALRPAERPNFLNLSSVSDSPTSGPEPSPSPKTSSYSPLQSPRSEFREGFLIERFRQSRQDRVASARSQSDIASCAGASDVELEQEAPDSLDCARESFRHSGASTPTDEFRTFPSRLATLTANAVQAGVASKPAKKITSTDAADSGISDRWESQGSSCGSTGSYRRNHGAMSYDSVSAGPSSLSSTDATPDSSLGHAPEATSNEAPVLTQWAHLVDVPIRTSTPVKQLTTWAEHRDKSSLDVESEDHEVNQNRGLSNAANTSTETTFSYKTTKSHLSRYEDSTDEFEVAVPVRTITRPSKLALLKEREQDKFKDEAWHNQDIEPNTPKTKKPLDELKKKWQAPYDLIPSGTFLPLPTHTRLRCSPDIPPSSV